MTENKVTACRLCLRIVDDNYEYIHQSERYILGITVPQLDLDKSNDPVVCKKCWKNLLKCYEFKLLCLKSTDPKSSPVPVGGYMVLKMCKICQKTEDVIYAEYDELMTMMEKCFPDQKLFTGKALDICKACFLSLQNLFSFTMDCLYSEEKIQKYCRQQGTNSKGQVNLCSVVQFDLKYVEDDNNSSITDIKVKEETNMYTDNINLENSSITDTKVKEETNMYTDNINFAIKNEEIYIKSDNDERTSDIKSEDDERKSDIKSEDDERIDFSSTENSKMEETNEDFWEDLQEAFLSADIPFDTLNHPTFRNFLEKYCQRSIPNKSALRKRRLES